MSNNKTREIWVDYVKVFACVFVVLGHFFQSMTISGILPAGALYNWFNYSVQQFHVPLFFICSGYLFSKYSSVRTLGEYKRNIYKKALNLGVPYLFFSTVSWVMKTVFSSSVNSEVGPLWYSLFVSPILGYWFLYCLLLIFMISPTIKTKKEGAVLLVIALIMRVVWIFTGDFTFIEASAVLRYFIWFVIGGILSRFDLTAIFKNKAMTACGFILAALFIAGSIAVSKLGLKNGFIDLALGLIMCFGVIFVIGGLFYNKESRFFLSFSKYTLPIYVMHTIFAAALRIALVKLGVTMPAVHIVLGLAICFAGPIIAAVIMEKTVYLEFFIYPVKVINKIKAKKQG